MEVGEVFENLFLVFYVGVVDVVLWDFVVGGVDL